MHGYHYHFRRSARQVYREIEQDIRSCLLEMILHLDLDAFFVSAHRSIDKTLIGKKVAVGGRSDQFIFQKHQKKRKAMLSNNGAFVQSLFFSKDKKYDSNFYKDGNRIRGIITTASYEARKYGIKTGISIKEALLLCSDLIVLPPDMMLYHSLSHRLKLFLKRNLPVVEQYSIDEFFADCSGYIDDGNVLEYAKWLQSEIEKKFHLPISIGIAKTKWIAKLATSRAKPKGLLLIEDGFLYDFIKDIAIEEFPGIGKAWVRKLHRYKKFTLDDIYNSKALLYSWGRAGRELYDKVSGDFFESLNAHRDRKSIGISRTFDPLLDREEIKRRIYILSRHLSFIMTKLDAHPTTIHLSVKYEFKERSKKDKTLHRVFSETFLKNEFIKLFDEIDIYKHTKIIRLSLSLSNFKTKQIYSLIDYNSDKTLYNLSKNINSLREKYGLDIVKNAIEFA